MPSPQADLQTQLDALAKRVDVLEAAQSSAEVERTKPLSKINSPDADDRYWALNGLSARAPEGGAVLYTGDVALPGGGRVIWQREAACTELFSKDWADLSDTIAALGHPVRMAVLRACMGQQRSTQELLALPGIGTTGQLFHHLKTLQQCGWLRSTQRGMYELPADRIVPLLAMLTAAAK